MVDKTFDRRSLVDGIYRAYAHEVLSNGVTLRQARAMDDFHQAPQPIPGDPDNTVRRWQDIPDSELREHDDVLPFLCPMAFRFYIPAFMIWAIKHLELRDEDSGLIGPTIYSFNLGTPCDTWHLDQLRRFEFLNLAQKISVCQFLRHLLRHDCLPSDVRIYLSLYWGQFCAGAD